MTKPLHDCHVLALPGPGHFPYPLSKAHRLDQRYAPRSIWTAICGYLQGLLDDGLPVLLLPPVPRMAAIAAAVSDQRPDPEWLELQLAAPDIATQYWANWIPHSDSSDDHAALIPANRCSDEGGRWATAQSDILARALASLPHLRVCESAPASPLFASQGQAQHLRMTGSDAAALHHFAFGNGALMPDTWRPREARARQSRGAQLYTVRAGQLRPGRALIMRQHWQAMDAGAATLRQVCCGHGDLWIMHESCCGDQHSWLQTSQDACPGVRIHVLRDRECRLRDLRQQQPLGAVLIGDGDSAQGRQLIYDPRWDDKRAQRVRQQLCDDGLISGHRPGIDPRLLGLPYLSAWHLRLDLDSSQLNALPPSLRASPHLLQQLQDWASHSLPEELRAEDFQRPAILEQLAEAESALLACCAFPTTPTHDW